MATVAEMIEWFQTLPAAAEVYCGYEIQHGYSTSISNAPVDIEKSAYYGPSERYPDKLVFLQSGS